MKEHYYEPNGIVIHMYKPVKEKRFYLTKDGIFLEDKSQALIWKFKNVRKFNEWLKENVLEIVETYGDTVRFEKRRRFTPIKKGEI